MRTMMKYHKSLTRIAIVNSQPKINFFNDPQFTHFKMSLDGEMKRLQSSGKGVTKRQAEPLTVEEEDILWPGIRVYLGMQPLKTYLTLCYFFAVVIKTKV